MQITTLPKDDVKRGEIYYISRGGYNTGSEQQADRPGVIVSNDKNNKNSQTLEVVYLTTQPKNELPTHCTIRSTGRVSTVLCEQIHTVAVERIGKYIGVCTAQEMQNIDIGLMISIGLGDAGGATKDKTVVTDQKEEKKAEEKKTEEKVQTETNEELIKTTVGCCETAEKQTESIYDAHSFLECCGDEPKPLRKCVCICQVEVQKKKIRRRIQSHGLVDHAVELRADRSG